MPVFEITSYSVSLHASSGDGTNQMLFHYMELTFPKPEPTQPPTVPSPNWKGFIYFFIKHPGTPPTHVGNLSGSNIYGILPAGQFTAVYDILRSEKPVYLHWDHNGDVPSRVELLRKE